MEMTSTRPVPAPLASVWAALNDPDVIKACVPGCEVMESDGPDAYRIVVATKVGPVSARFAGRLILCDVDPLRSYTLRFEGQGGAAGFARGEARVALAEDDPQSTKLDYAVKAQVGGKIAQIGSRLVDGAAQKLADDFFARFCECMCPPMKAEGAEGLVAGEDEEELRQALEHGEPGAAGDTAMVAAPVADAARARAVKTPAPTSTDTGGSPWIRYVAIVAIAALLVYLYFTGRH